MKIIYQKKPDYPEIAPRPDNQIFKFVQTFHKHNAGWHTKPHIAIIFKISENKSNYDYVKYHEVLYLEYRFV